MIINGCNGVRTMTINGCNFLRTMTINRCNNVRSMKMVIKDAYLRYETTQVILVATAFNPADCLSKVKDNGALLKLIISSFDSSTVEQWIVRPQPSPSLEKDGSVKVRQK